MPGAAASADPAGQSAKAECTGTAQEVRFAVAMSGGVSLAVWMGGVAREMNLLQQASNRRRLLSDRSGSGDAQADAGIRADGGRVPARLLTGMPGAASCT